MWNTIGSLAKDILTSKKALATISAIIVTGLSRAGIALDPATANMIAGSLGAYVLGQGVADIGKPAAKFKSMAAAQGAVPISESKP